MRIAPNRGDLVWLNFSPQSGHEQAGRRTALILSPQAFNDRVGLAFVCPITSRIRGRGFEVLLPDGLPVKGAILVEHLRSLDWDSREVELICAAPLEVLQEVQAKLNLILH